MLDDDIDPHHQWKRPLQAPGHTQVDFEERVNFRRLHTYRLARVRQALAGSGLGALLSFDQHNIRYTTSTVIGEWARDKLLRYSLITGNGDPYIWDFGSAAKHHKLYAPWLQQRSLPRGHARHARRRRLRPHAVPRCGARDQGDPRRGGRRPHAGRRRRRRAADAVRAAEGRHRGARRPADDAARARDQVARRDHAAEHGGRDGRRRVPGHRRGAEARHQGVGDRRARGGPPLRDGLGLRRGDQLDRRRALRAASAQLHGSFDPPRRPGVLRRHPFVHRLSHVLLPHVRGRPRDGAAAHGVSQGARVDGQRDRAAEARHGQRRGRESAADWPRTSASRARSTRSA